MSSSRKSASLSRKATASTLEIRVRYRLPRSRPSLRQDRTDQATDPEEIHVQEETIHPKHAHVLLSAIRGNAGILLTIDRKHFLS